MFNLPRLNRQSAATLRAEMKEVIARYERASLILIRIIDADTTVAPEDKTDRKYKTGQDLWDLVYGSYYEKLSIILKKINEAYDESQKDS